MDGDGKIDLVVGRQEARGSIFFNQGDAKKFQFEEAAWGDGAGTVYGPVVAAAPSEIG